MGAADRSRRRRRATAPAWRERLATWFERVRPATILRAVMFTALIGAMSLAGYRLLDVPVTRVTVEGPFRRVSSGQIEAVLRERLPAGFLSADLEKIRDAVEALSWVDVVRVRRVWPDGVLVSVTEHEADVRWGDRGLVNTRGELFLRDSRHLPAELPRLDGPAGSEGALAERYRDYSDQLATLGLRVLALSMDARGAWRMRVRGSGTGAFEVRLGRRDPDARMRRFVEVAGDLLGSSGDRIAYVDMRYGHGFAVGWKDSSVALEQGERRSDATQS
jgi:cell division protein FtsQ